MTGPGSDEESVLDALGQGILREGIEFALQSRDRARIRPAGVHEDHQDGVAHRDLFMEVIDDPEDPVYARVEREGVDAVEDDGPGTVLVDERACRDPQFLNPTRVDRAHRARNRRDADGLAAVRDLERLPGRDPEERGLRGREGSEERDDDVLWTVGEIAQAPP